MTGNEFIRLVSETLFGIILGTVLSVPIHESGHLAGGLLTGYKFVSFRIAGVKLVRDCTDFRLKKGSLTPIGQCIMTSDRMDRSPVLLILGGIAANLIDRRFLGIEQEQEYAELSRRRRLELDDYHMRLTYRDKIKDIKLSEALTSSGFVCEEDEPMDLPF